MRPSSLFIFLSQEDSVGSFGCNSAGVNQEDQSSGGNANVRWRDEGNKSLWINEFRGARNWKHHHW